MRYFCRCLCVSKNKSLKELSRPDYYINKGVDKLDEDLDIVGVIRMVHNVDIMQATLFSEFQ